MLTSTMETENSSDQFELSNYIMIPANNKSNQFDIQLVENFLVRKLPDGNVEVVNEETNNDNTAVINETAFLNPIDTVQLFENSVVNNKANETTENESNKNNETSKEGGDLEPPAPQPKKRERQYKCIRCEKKLSTLEMYRKHMTWHKLTKKFMCTKCSQGFNVEDNLKVHTVYVHSEGNNSCPLCDTKFHRKAGLKNHVLSHQVDELNTCDMCHSEFDTEEELLKHMEFHVISEAKFKNTLICNYCKLQFKSSSDYRLHISQHLKVKKAVSKKKRRKKQCSSPCPFVCNSCGKKFPKMAHLERHERVHTGERPFVCQICNKSFNQKVTLNNHMMNHTGLKPYACTLCPQKFNQKSNLRSHMEKTHIAPQGSGEMFRCQQCTCIFKRISTLNGHVTKVHIQHPPTVVDEIMQNLKTLHDTQDPKVTNKENTDNFSTVKLTERDSNGKLKRFAVKYQKIDDVKYFYCNNCTIKFKKPSDLLRHIRQKHTKEKPYKCKLCDCQYSLKSALALHYKVHNREKLLCNVCGESFKTNRQMKAHLKQHDKENAPNYQCALCNFTFHTIEEGKEHRNVHLNEISPTQDIIQPYLKQPLFETIYGTLPLKPPKPRVPNTGTECALNRPHACETCGARFTKKINLDRHLKSHLMEKKFKCHICPQAFITAYRLKVHLYYHQNIRNYSCSICNKRFVTSSLLKRHLIVHNTHRPYMCPYCQKRFKTLIMCRAHIKQVHKLEPPENSTLQVEADMPREEQNNAVTNNMNTIEIKVGDQEPIVITVPMAVEQQQDFNEVEYLNLNNVFTQNEPIFINTVGDLQDPSGIIFNMEVQNMVNPNEVINNSVTKPRDERKEEILPNDDVLQNNDIILQGTNFILQNDGVLLQNNDVSQNIDVVSQNNNIVSEILDGGNFVGPWETNIDYIQESVLNELTSNAQIPEENDTSNLERNHSIKIEDEIEENVIGEFVNEEEVTVTVPPEEKKKRKKVSFEDDVKKLFKCILCSRRCTSMQTYTRHIQTYHSDEGALLRTCKFCKKEFKKTSDLQRHLRTHTGERPYTCHTCGKNFALKSTLKGHERVHLMPPKTVTCTVCNMQFSGKYSLKVHMSIHSGRKPHKCSFCDKKFRTSANKRTHENAIHINNKRDEKKAHKVKTTPSKAAKLLETIAEEVAKSLMEECLQKSEQNAALVMKNEVAEETTKKTAEETRVENQSKNDSNARLSFDSEILKDLGPRKREKPPETVITNERDMLTFFRAKQRRGREKVRCDICNKIYSSKDVLKKHVRNIHEKKKHSCPSCKATFATEAELERHRKVHEDYKAYSCQYCECGFSDELGLRIHMHRFHQKPDETPNVLLNLHMELPLEVTGSFI